MNKQEAVKLIESKISEIKVNYSNWGALVIITEYDDIAADKGTYTKHLYRDKVIFELEYLLKRIDYREVEERDDCALTIVVGETVVFNLNTNEIEFEEEF